MGEDCYQLEDVLLPLVMIIICAICSIFIFLTFICKYNESGSSSNKTSSSSGSSKTSSKKDASQIKLAAAITLTMYSISPIFFLISIFSNGDCLFSRDIAGPGFIFHFFAFTVVLVTFTFRIVKTFENTSYAVSERAVKIVYYGVIPFVVILMIINSILRLTNRVALEVTVLLALGFILLEIVWVIWVLRLFITRLNQVMNDFIKQFGKVSQIDLAKLNKSVSYVLIFEFLNFCVKQ